MIRKVLVANRGEIAEFSEFYILHFHEGTSFLRLSKKFFTFLSLFGMLDVYLELFCLN